MPLRLSSFISKAWFGKRRYKNGSRRSIGGDTSGTCLLHVISHATPYIFNVLYFFHFVTYHWSHHDFLNSNLVAHPSNMVCSKAIKAMA